MMFISRYVILVLFLLLTFFLCVLIDCINRSLFLALEILNLRALVFMNKATSECWRRSIYHIFSRTTTPRSGNTEKLGKEVLPHRHLLSLLVSRKDHIASRAFFTGSSKIMAQQCHNKMRGEQRRQNNSIVNHFLHSRNENQCQLAAHAPV